VKQIQHLAAALNSARGRRSRNAAPPSRPQCRLDPREPPRRGPRPTSVRPQRLGAELRIRAAGFDAWKTLDGFDWTPSPRTAADRRAGVWSVLDRGAQRRGAWPAPNRQDPPRHQPHDHHGPARSPKLFATKTDWSLPLRRAPHRPAPTGACDAARHGLTVVDEVGYPPFHHDAANLRSSLCQRAKNTLADPHLEPGALRLGGLFGDRAAVLVVTGRKVETDTSEAVS
jgi:hypothetical protein